jgi:hypothetical protein
MGFRIYGSLSEEEHSADPRGESRYSSLRGSAMVDEARREEGWGDRGWDWEGAAGGCG